MTASATVGATTRPTGATQRGARTHLYEIDLTRGVTALSVIGVHVGFYTLALATTDLGVQMQNAAVDLLHFTREIFLAITAFVLTYSYANRPFSAKAFWRKRGLSVMLPYVVLSIFYEVLTKPALPPLEWLVRLGGDLLSGHASWQLYYILLTLEFYLILPWFLAFINWTGKRPWLLFGVSFAVQFVLLTLDYTFPQSTQGVNTGIGLFIDTHQDRFLPLYQFYIICGALAALYMPQVRAWVQRHGALIIAGFVIAAAWLLGNFFFQVDVEHQAASYASSVFEPPMAFYGLTVSAFVYWIALRWANSRVPRPPRGARFWLLISDISFGIYLLHAYFVDLAVEHVVPHIPRTWPQVPSVLIIYLGVVVCTIIVCIALLYLPGLSRLIGRPWALRETDVGRWFEQRLAQAWATIGSVTGRPRGSAIPAGTETAARTRATQAEPTVDLGSAGPQ